MNVPESTKLKIRDLIASGKKLEAVKYVREQFGLGLKDSLKLVEAVEESDASAPGGYQKRAFVPRGSTGPDKIVSLLSAIFLGVAILLLAIGAAIAYNTNQELNHAQRLTGTVVDFAYSSSRSSSPVVVFNYNGQPRTIQGSVASSPPAYDIGEEVTVYVIRDGGETFRIGGILELWFGPMILAFIGIIFLFIGGVMYAINRKM